MKIIQLILINMVLFLGSNLALAQSWIDSNKAIPNLQKVLKEAQKELAFSSMGKTLNKFIAFPAQIPKPEETLFAQLVMQDEKTSASIVIGNRQGCTGEKDCWMIDLHFDVDKNPVIIYDVNNKRITKEVILHQNVRGYFTTEYALGSTFPMNLSWRDGAVLYTLSVWGWRSLSEWDLIVMANSVIDTLHTKILPKTSHQEQV